MATRSNASRGSAASTATATSLPSAASLSSASTPSASISLSPSTAAPTISEHERIRIEFYATYDVMTGVRIAATLGGFFGLMVMLIVCKSKSKTQKEMDGDPHLAAVAAEAAAEAAAEVEVEEEVRAALEATAAWSVNPRHERDARRSLGNMSAPVPRATMRFSSVGGGYGALLAPPTRASLPGSALRFGTCAEDEDDDDDEDDYDAFDEALNDDVTHLSVNKGYYRRCSNITCSSSDSSYLERRGSTMIGLPPPPPAGRRRSSGWDLYSYPIDIQVIQPTPDASPRGSERALHLTPGGLQVPRLAPLATISSCASSALDARSSVGSDSVFDEACCDDTDDEITQFSTDSDASGDTLEEEDEDDDACPPPRRVRSWRRRASAPVQRRHAGSFSRRKRSLKNAESTHLLLCDEHAAETTSCCASSDASATLRGSPPRPTQSVIQMQALDHAGSSSHGIVSRSQETLF